MPISVKRHRKRLWLARFLGSFARRLFCHRNIIIISEHKTEHVPVSMPLQILLIAGILGFVAWGSYSTGNYMAARQALQEKERKIASASLENRRIESEFALLKRDLIKMIEEEQDNPSEYAQFVVEQYKNGGTEGEAMDIDVSQLGGVQHAAVFERIAFLEQTVEALKENHQVMIESIRATARGKLEELETIIQATGLKANKLEQQAAVELPEVVNATLDNRQQEDSQGGPYNPLYKEALLEQDAKLYHDLTRMSILADVVDSLPLAVPMKDEYRITSGFGPRMDPFRKRWARHTGLDFAGPWGAEVYATTEGVVSQAGRRGAYGLSVEIEHPLGISTLYGHLHRIRVKEGETVKAGDVVGIQGSTGRSTGPHLHYEVRYNGAKVDPAGFLKAGKKAGYNDVRKIED